MLNKFDSSYMKLIQILDERVKDVSSKKLLQELKENVNSTECKYY